jgi:HEPN domain-containing protein
MPRKHLPPNDPREWLRRAQSNHARAASPLPDAYLEDFCFDAQQAAEKAIKAVFMAHGLTFPYIHDLGRLLTVLAQAGVRVPQYVQEADQLTRFAVDARYPGLSSPVTKREHRRAVRIATGVLRWATRRVERLCP